MKVLPEISRQSNFNYKQLIRDGKYAIYEKSKHNCIICYEVIQINSHENYQIAGITIEAAEVYPSSESWGTLGFTYKTKELAFKKFEELKNKKDNIIDGHKKLGRPPKNRIDNT